ncbi:MAG: cyclic nucleotide-binding domain-containing protein, partial [Ignavibacteriaceae bacterium]
MEKTVIKEFLKHIQLFKELNDAQLDAVCNKLTIENYSANSLLFSENNIRKNLFLIYDGKVELFKRTPYGGEKRLSAFSKYDFLGEGAIMDDSPHSTSARAKVDSIVLILTRDSFKE